MRAPQHADEGARQAALAAFQVLGTPPESAFEDITALAATITGAPNALLSFVDAERQWFKSIVNFAVRETSRTSPAARTPAHTARAGRHPG